MPRPNQIPRPFKRPAVELSNGGVKREWKNIPVSQLTIGDVVAGEGLVEKIAINEENNSMVVYYPSSSSVFFNLTITVYAFTAGGNS